MASSTFPTAEKAKEIDALVKSLQIVNLNLNEDLRGIPFRSELVCDLAVARHQVYFYQRRTRKAIWVQENRKETCARTQFQNRMELLPELVWGKVLEKLGEPRDKLVMSNMTRLWGDLLKNQRTHFLFHEVFPVIHKTNYVPKNDLLSCRRVCKEWRDVFDQCIQHHSPRIPLTLESSLLEMPWGAPGFDLLSHEGFPQILAFRREAESNYSGVNPFLSRKLSVKISYDGTIQFQNIQFQLLPELQRVLRRWGDQLWSLHFALDSISDFHIYYKDICAFLELTRNLRMFSVSFSEMGGSGKGEVVDSQNPDGPEYWLSLPTDLLPELPHLKILAGQYLSFKVVRGMLQKYSSTLESVMIGRTGVATRNLVDGSSLPRLKRLCFIRGFAPDMKEEGFQVNWPNLEELGMIYHEVKPEDVPVIFQNLSGIGHHSKSLRHLALTLVNEQSPIAKLDGRQTKMLSLNLPQVEKFTLTVSRVTLKNVDFLLPMTKLKELVLIYNKFVTSFQKTGTGSSKKSGSPTSTGNPIGKAWHEIIKFTVFTNNLYESNIWQLFPELKKVTIMVHSRLKNKMKKKKEELFRLDNFEEWNEKSISFKRRTYDREGYVLYSRLMGDQPF